MTQWVKALVAKPGNLSFLPETDMVEGEKGLSQVVL